MEKATNGNSESKRNIFMTLLALFIGAVVGIGYMMWAYLLRPIIKSQRTEAGKLNAILNSIADGVIVQNLAGEIETMNPSARKIIDSTINSLAQVSRTDDKNLQGRSQARFASLLSFLTNLRFYESQDVEIGQRVLSARSAPILEADEQLGSVVVLRDVTAEAEAKRLKDDFITTISHELRTPLSVIKGYNDLLRMNASHIVEAYRDNFLQNIHSVDQNIDTLLNLIEQMLDLTQINAGALGIDEDRIDLSEIVKMEADQWQKNMREKSLTYQQYLPSEPIWVKGDEDRLARVVHNLLKNAYSYTLPGGEVELGVKIGSDQVRVDVRDTGVGIAAKDQPLIFSRFFRAIHAEDTYEISGAGLGLFLSRAIIEAHGGKIWFESKINQGSTFSFILPTIDNSSNNKHP